LGYLDRYTEAATVQSERCGYHYALVRGTTSGTRCDASVRSTTRSGQVIGTTVTDALPYEFSHRAGRPTTIQLRYDSNDPTQPFKQSNDMSVGEFLLTVGIGLVIITGGIWALLSRPERPDERAVSLPASHGWVMPDLPDWLGGAGKGSHSPLR
jgi:hypothetical protein